VVSRNELNILQQGRASLHPHTPSDYYFFIKNRAVARATRSPGWPAEPEPTGLADIGNTLPRWMGFCTVYAVQSGNSKTEKKLEIEPDLRGRVSSAGEGNSMVSSFY
jgi:hypothetical protein